MAWWNEAVFYEIYIRSFQDSNGDGIGDLNGITSRLPYLAALGIDAIWVTPFYPSPQVDFGYDITDHEAVDPAFGTLADFDHLVTEAHHLGIKVIIDLVLNHTSDRHPRFQAARGSRTSEYRDWFVWHDGRGESGPPNNWESAFGGPAWSFDRATSQWYYHCFYPEQPDLNWRNPSVEAWMFDTVRFWLARGVDGFRLDAVHPLFEDAELRDNPVLSEPRMKLTGVESQETVYTRGLPEMYDVLSRLRRLVDREAPDTLLISEAYVDSASELLPFYGSDAVPAVHLPFNFLLAQASDLSAHAFKVVVEEIERAFERHWPSLVLNNHDIDRAVDRYGQATERDAVARLLAVMLLTLRGTPFLYYGDEIGMRTQPPAHFDDVRDPVGRRFWPRYKGRDGVRRPMQWDGSAHAGFTSGEPWLPIASDAASHNVERHGADPESVFSLHRALLAFRRSSTALRRGSYRTVLSDSDVMAYLREDGEERVLVVLNCCGQDRRAGVADPAVGASGRVAVASNPRRTGTIALGPLRLAPFEAIVVALGYEHG